MSYTNNSWLEAVLFAAGSEDVDLEQTPGDITSFSEQLKLLSDVDGISSLKKIQIWNYIETSNIVYPWGKALFDIIVTNFFSEFAEINDCEKILWTYFRFDKNSK